MRRDIPVRLTKSETFHAASAGIQRRIEGIFSKTRSDKHGLKGLGWDIDVEGVAAEMAAAKALYLAYTFVLEISDDPAALEGDIAPGIEVRATTHRNGCLIIHPEDKDDSKFILVTGQIPNFKVVGWLQGKEAKQDQWWRTDTGRPAYFVPQTALYSFNRD